LKIDVIAVDCDADTFSQTFNLQFDTTVMRFRYQVSDTIISIYEDYYILIDSLVEDHSRAGIDISLSAVTNGIVTFEVLDDTVRMIPDRVGSTDITITAADSFTGKEYQQQFFMEIYDPLNHAPYHSDSMITGYVIQLNDTLLLDIGDIFTDPDGDLPDYFFTILDTSLAAGWLSGDILSVSGMKAGITNLSISASDNRGGEDSVIIDLHVNTAPNPLQQLHQSFFRTLQEQITIDLKSLFTDADDDTLSYTVGNTQSGKLIYNILNDFLQLFPQVIDTLSFFVVASDNHGGIDSTMIRLIYQPKLYVPGTKRLIGDLRIFPNPTSGTIHLQFTSESDRLLSIRLVDLTGRIVFQKDNLHANIGTNHFDINNGETLTKGTYLLVLYFEDAISATIGVLVE
jgi:hypothetical protein